MFKKGLTLGLSIDIMVLKVRENLNEKEKTMKTKNSEINPLIGMNLNTSWGYSMTINDYAQIIDVSPTGKTVKCRLVNKIMNDGAYAGDGSGKAKCGSEVHGPIFRLKVDGNNRFHGSYPFCAREDDDINTPMKHCSTRMGYFSKDSGGEKYENHWD